MIILHENLVLLYFKTVYYYLKILFTEGMFYMSIKDYMFPAYN